jgi:DnaJ-class molecular chaperone
MIRFSKLLKVMIKKIITASILVASTSVFAQFNKVNFNGVSKLKEPNAKLESQHHPDKGGDTATFQKIEEAYRILSDPQKRQEHDNPVPPFNFNGHPGGFNFNANGFDLNDLFGQMFNQRQSAQPRQQTYRTSINVSLEQAYFGGQHSMQLQTPTGNKMLQIDMPKGIHNGNQVKVDNVIDGASLIVEFRVSKHLKYDRIGNDLVSNHSLSVLDLIAGGSFEFTTLSGKTLEVTIKPKTQPYIQLKISGQGMPIYGAESAYGDQIILIKPYIPDTIDQTIIDSIVQSKTNKEYYE